MYSDIPLGVFFFFISLSLSDSYVSVLVGSRGARWHGPGLFVLAVWMAIIESHQLVISRLSEIYVCTCPQAVSVPIGPQLVMVAVNLCLGFFCHNNFGVSSPS